MVLMRLLLPAMVLLATVLFASPENLPTWPWRQAAAEIEVAAADIQRSGDLKANTPAVTDTLRDFAAIVKSGDVDTIKACRRFVHAFTPEGEHMK